MCSINVCTVHRNLGLRVKVFMSRTGRAFPQSLQCPKRECSEICEGIFTPPDRWERRREVVKMARFHLPLCSRRSAIFNGAGFDGGGGSRWTSAATPRPRPPSRPRDPRNVPLYLAVAGLFLTPAGVLQASRSFVLSPPARCGISARSGREADKQHSKEAWQSKPSTPTSFPPKSSNRPCLFIT